MTMVSLYDMKKAYLGLIGQCRDFWLLCTLKINRFMDFDHHILCKKEINLSETGSFFLF